MKFCERLRSMTATGQEDTQAAADQGPALNVPVARTCGRLPGARFYRGVTPDGKPFRFYENLSGRPTVLLFWAGAQSPMAVAGLEALAAERSLFGELGVEVLAIAPDDTPPLERDDLPFRFFVPTGMPKWPMPTDTAAGLQSGYRSGLADCVTPPSVSMPTSGSWVSFRTRPVGQAGQVAELYQALTAWQETPGLIAEPAPILCLPGLLDPAFCDELIAYWEKGNVFEGTVGSVADQGEYHRVYHDKKKRLDCRIEDPELHAAMELAVGRRIAPEMEKAFCFANFHFERFLIVCYDAERQDFFRPHRDNLSPDTATRRFAVTINLNDDYRRGRNRLPGVRAAQAQNPQGRRHRFLLLADPRGAAGDQGQALLGLEHVPPKGGKGLRVTI